MDIQNELKKIAKAVGKKKSEKKVPAKDIRKVWKIDPRTRVKDNDKKYKRDKKIPETE